MIVVLYGPDEYRRRKKLREILAAFKNKYLQGSVLEFDLEDENSLERIREFADAQSMFEPMKLVIMYNLEAGTKELAKLIERHAERRELTIVISDSHKPASPFAFLLKNKKDSQSIQAQEFEFLKDASWRSFVDAEAKERDVKLSPEALGFLSDAYVRDSWGVATELEKLSGMPKKVIERKDLEELGLETSPDFWAVVTALKNPLPARRLAALQNLFKDRQPAAKIFHMIAYQWPEKLEMLAAYDRAIKSGKLDYEEALTDLALG